MSFDFVLKPLTQAMVKDTQHPEQLNLCTMIAESGEARIGVFSQVPKDINQLGRTRIMLPQDPVHRIGVSNPCLYTDSAEDLATMQLLSSLLNAQVDLESSNHVQDSPDDGEKNKVQDKLSLQLQGALTAATVCFRCMSAEQWESVAKESSFTPVVEAVNKVRCIALAEEKKSTLNTCDEWLAYLVTQKKLCKGYSNYAKSGMKLEKMQLMTEDALAVREFLKAKGICTSAGFKLFCHKLEFMKAMAPSEKTGGKDEERQSTQE